MTGGLLLRSRRRVRTPRPAPCVGARIRGRLLDDTAPTARNGYLVMAIWSRLCCVIGRFYRHWSVVWMSGFQIGAGADESRESRGSGMGVSETKRTCH